MSDSAYDQTPGVDPLLETYLAELGLIHSRLQTIEGLNANDSPRLMYELTKLRQDVELRIEVWGADLKRERVPED